MATARPFAYNTGSPIDGTTQVGDLSVGTPTSGFTNNPQFWNGPDEELGYVIASPVSGNTQPTQVPEDAITLSSTYKGTDVVLSNNNQTAQQLFGYQQSVLGVSPIGNADKVMFSVLCTLLDPPTSPNSHFVGIGYTSMNYSGNPYGGYPGNDGQSMGYGSDGNIWYNGAIYLGGLQTWTTGDIIDIVVNNSSNTMWVRVNGGNWDNNPSDNPATNTGGFEIINAPFYPVLCPGYEGTMEVLNYPKYGVPSDYNFLGNVSASVGFYRTSTFTDNSFISLSQYVATKNNTPQTFSSATDASIWLTNNGFWNSYITPVLYLDAGNAASYSGSGTVWTDLIGGKVFNLINGPTYDSGNGGKINFNAASGQYAECNTSLTSLPIFTTSVWHYWDGVNSGGLPCILTEVYVGGSLNYVLGAPQGSVAQSGYFNGGFQVSPQFSLTANNWYQIVTTCDASQNVSVYVNNTLISTTPTSGPQPSSGGAGINLMKRWDGFECWGGYLSTVAIYDKALDSGQISSIWNTTKSRYGL
jgi:hypothetical protein